jgi:hypothetical protein
MCVVLFVQMRGGTRLLEVKVETLQNEAGSSMKQTVSTAITEALFDMPACLTSLIAEYVGFHTCSYRLPCSNLVAMEGELCELHACVLCEKPVYFNFPWHCEKHGLEHWSQHKARYRRETALLMLCCLVVFGGDGFLMFHATFALVNEKYWLGSFVSLATLFLVTCCKLADKIPSSLVHTNRKTY